MAYEYESRLKNRLLDLEFDTWEETVQFEREYRELERVYRKAKAWDNYISELREKKTEEMKITFGAMLSRQVDKEVEKIERKYMEDK